MKVAEMLTFYRSAAPPAMQAVAAEFLALSASEQREFLFWMCVDTATNPTSQQRSPQNGQ